MTQNEASYYMDVLLRHYARMTEELEICHEEIASLERAYGEIIQENSDLRFKIQSITGKSLKKPYSKKIQTFGKTTLEKLNA